MKIRDKKNPDIHTKRQMQIRKHTEKKKYRKPQNRIKKAAEATGSKKISDQLDGGEELHQSAQLAGEILRPVTVMSEKGAALLKESVLEKKRKKYKVVTPRKDNNQEVKGVKTNREAKAREKNKVVSKDRDKAESGKTPQQSKKQGGNGKRSLRSRKIKAFLEKRKAKMQADNPENQNTDFIGSKIKGYEIKAALAILGVLGGILSLIVLITVPVVLLITLLYNSPFALFLPPVTGGDMVQAVTETYVTEFLAEAEREADDHAGYDEGEIYYRDPDGNAVLPMPQKDILCVYMVKYGVGDTATVMNDKARKRLLGVVEDMCSYTTSDRTEQRKDEKGKKYEVTILEVHVVIKDYLDMAVEYGFSEEQMELLEMMMYQ